MPKYVIVAYETVRWERTIVARDEIAARSRAYRLMEEDCPCEPKWTRDNEYYECEVIDVQELDSTLLERLAEAGEEEVKSTEEEKGR